MSKYDHLKITYDKSTTARILDIDPDLELQEKQIGLHAINPFIAHNSSARGYMLASHISQTVALENPEEHIIQSGLEPALADATFGPVAENDVIVMDTVKRYDNSIDGYVNECIEWYTFVYSEVNKELDIIKIPAHHTGLTQGFGFEYKPNKKVLNKMKIGSFIPKGTKLATSPGVKENGGWGFGLNANMLLCTHPDTTEDGVVISESLAKRMSFVMYETKVIEFGANWIPLNIYGDENNYKAFPEIGERINDASMLMALRNYDNLDPDIENSKFGALGSVKDMMTVDHNFDKCWYVKEPGSILEDNTGKVKESGVIVDIVAYRNPKVNSLLWPEVEEKVMKYSDSYIKFCTDLINAYDNICKELRISDYGYGPNEITIGDELHALMVHAGTIACNHNTLRIKNNHVLNNLAKNMKSSGSNNLPSTLGLAYRTDDLDAYRMEFTIKYVIELAEGNKISDLSGAKGVITHIYPDNEMPFNEHTRADIVMDSNSVVSRMNLARNYMHLINDTSRFVQFNLRAMTNNKKIEDLSDNEIEKMFYYLMEFLGLFATQQFDYYANTDISQKREILKECIEKEVYIYNKVSNPKRAYQIVQDIRASKFYRKPTPVTIPIHDKVTGKISYLKTKTDLRIAPMYTILLNKTADNPLCCASPSTNNFGFPVSTTPANRDRKPYRNNPTKIMSETENRLFASYAGIEAVAELKDRANSPQTHELVYRNILKADQPTNVDTLVDRTKHPFGTDVTIKIHHSIFRLMGMDFVYSESED